MKRPYLVLDDQEMIGLYRILTDDDAPAALAFPKSHLRGKVRELLEGVER